MTLADEIDVSRGDVLAAADAPPEVADQFEATIVWMHDQPMLQGRSYLMKIGTQTVTATVAPLKYKINVNTLEHVAAQEARAERDWRLRPRARPAGRRSSRTPRTAISAASS